MNKWILTSLVILAIPFMIAYMWIRHPILSLREMRSMWRMIWYDEDDGKGLY